MNRALDPQAYLAKADRALRAAKLLLREGDTDGVGNRAYYTMSNAAHAALLNIPGAVPEAGIKTHRGLIAAFGQHIVRSKLLPAHLGAALNKAERLRKIADYTGDPLTIEDVQWVVQQAEAVVTAVRERLAS